MREPPNLPVVKEGLSFRKLVCTDTLRLLYHYRSPILANSTIANVIKGDTSFISHFLDS